jgi:hypothetical protein
MKTLFDELKKTMQKYDLYQHDDEVGESLDNLENAINTNTETRVYLINEDYTEENFNTIPNDKITDEQWMNESERQGSVYSLEGFVKDFNKDLVIV